jgi:hypothetical protein
MLRSLCFLIILFLFCQFSSFGQLLKWENDLDGRRTPIAWDNENFSVADSATGNHFSRINSQREYGIGYKGALPAEITNKNISVDVSAKIRTSPGNASLSVSFAINIGDSTIYWDSRRLSPESDWKMSTTNFKVPGSILKPGYIISVFYWSEGGKTNCDVDDLSIIFSKLTMSSFVPKLPAVQSHSMIASTTIKNDHFKLIVDTINQRSLLLSSSDDTLFTSPRFFISYKSKQTQKVLKELILEKPQAILISKTSDASIAEFKFRSKIATINLTYTLKPNNKIEIDYDIIWTKKLFVRQATLSFDYSTKIGKVFTKDHLVDSDVLSDEYWLQKEGVQFSGQKEDFLIYRNQKMSSMQLSTSDQRIFFNADFAMDHPYMYFPLMKTSKGSFYDRSCRNYLKGDKLSVAMNISAREKKLSVVRVLKNPAGYDASMVWTEHADYSDMRIQRAVNFGSEQIHSADSASGGFVGHRIPMTKSVFYANPEHQLNSIKDARFPSEAISILGTPGFEEFLLQLKRKQIEVCLHTPDPFTTTATRANEALLFMKNKFGSASWIDHGYDNSPLSNREDIVCDGLLPNSKYYLGKYFLDAGVKYFWNNYFEDTAVFVNGGFYSFFSSPYTGWGNAYPNPEYFNLPNVSAGFYSWTTNYTLDPSDSGLWDYFFSDNRLNDLVQNRTNIVLHCYPSRCDSTTGFYTYNDQEIVVEPRFDNVLSKLRKYNEEGKIWLTTIHELMDFRIALENVKVDYTTDGRCIIYNDGEMPIKNVSFATNAKSIFAGERGIQIKKYGNENVFILSLGAKEKLVVDIK